MAAGRHGGYRDNEFRVRESDFGKSRKEIIYPEGDFDKIRKVTSEFGRGQGRSRDSLEYRNKMRHNGFREREVTNGVYRSTLSRCGRNGAMPSGCGMTIRPVDREPGELSSDGSDGGIDPETYDYGGTEVEVLENGSQLTSLRIKKRKFSPIIWDKDDREAKQSVDSRTVMENTIQISKSPLAESHSDMPNSISISDVDIQTSLTDGIKVHISEVSHPKVDSLPYLSESHDVAPTPIVPEEPVSKSQALDTIYDDDDDMPARTIKLSRWANNADSPADEGEMSDYEDHQVLKGKSGSELGGHRKSSSPCIREVKREGSGKGRSSSSGERVRSSSRDSYHDTDDRNEYMEIDDNNYDDTDGGPSDIISKDDLRSCGEPEPIHPPRRSFNMLQGCRSVDEFERLNKIDEGTYGVVYRARDKKTEEIVALKRVKMEKEREGFPLTSLREINILLSFSHPYIVDVKEVVMGSNLNSIFMVMEYMEHDLKALMETMKQPFSQSEVKCLMLQLLEGTKYLHDNWVLHRDLKTSNLLLNNRGELKICDFGLARQYGSPLKPYTQLVVTLWYRAPELLLGAKQYSTAIDMWSLGCIMAELLSKEPLFNGKTEVDQLDKIYKILGTPSETIWPGLSKLPGAKVNFIKHKYNMLRKKFPATSFTGSPVLSDAGFDLLNKLLTYDPEKRITAEEALRHEWFREVPLPKSKEFMPTFPAQHAQDRRTRRVMKSPDPLEEQRRKELQGELGNGGLFGQ